MKHKHTKRTQDDARYNANCDKHERTFCYLSLRHKYSYICCEFPPRLFTDKRQYWFVHNFSLATTHMASLTSLHHCVLWECLWIRYFQEHIKIDRRDRFAGNENENFNENDAISVISGKKKTERQFSPSPSRIDCGFIRESFYCIRVFVHVYFLPGSFTGIYTIPSYTQSFFHPPRLFYSVPQAVVRGHKCSKGLPYGSNPGTYGRRATTSTRKIHERTLR